MKRILLAMITTLFAFGSVALAGDDGDCNKRSSIGRNADTNPKPIAQAPTPSKPADAGSTTY